MELLGGGASCHYNNTDATVNTFECEAYYEKKVALIKKIKVSVRLRIIAHIPKQTLDIKMYVGGLEVYKNPFPISAEYVPPMCADIMIDIGMCVALHQIHFDTSKECVTFQLIGYFEAFAARVDVIKENVGWNVPACPIPVDRRNLFLAK